MITPNRLKTYTTLAATPCAVLGGIAVDAYAGPGTGPITVAAGTLPGYSTSSRATNLFSAAGLQFEAMAFHYSNFNRGIGIRVTLEARAKISGNVKWWQESTASRTISYNASGAETTNWGYAGYGRSGAMSGFDQIGASGAWDDPRTGLKLGFALQQENGTYVAGWVDYDFNYNANYATLTINSWDFNVGADSESSAITMPATGGSDAVPGIGGLAGLAMGAAGLRRKRQRAA